MFNFFLLICTAILSVFSLGATVTGSWLVTVTDAEVSTFGTGIANMAQSFITVWMQIMPLIFPLLAVFLIFGFVKGFIKRR